MTSDNVLRYNPSTGDVLVPAEWSEDSADTSAEVDRRLVLRQLVDILEGHGITTEPAAAVEAVKALVGSLIRERDNARAASHLAVAVLDAAIVWRQMDVADADLSTGFTGRELALIAAVDAMLDARHDLRDTTGR